MQKLIISIIILFLTAVTAWAAEDFAFPKSDWSTTRAEIMDFYGAKPTRNDDYLTYNIPAILGMKTYIHYGFTKDDELAYMSYTLYTKPSTGGVHVDNYEKVKQNIAAHYGMPIRDNIYWFGDKYIPEATREIGETLYMREMRFITHWQLPETRLEIDMKGQGQEVVISVAYISDFLGKKFFMGVQNR